MQSNEHLANSRAAALPDRLRKRLTAALAPGERLIYVGRRRRLSLTATQTFAGLWSLFWCAACIPLVVLNLGAALGYWSKSDFPKLQFLHSRELILFFVPFTVICVGALLFIADTATAMLSTAYAATEQRLLVLRGGLFPLVISLPYARIISINSGIRTLYFGTHEARDEDGGRHIVTLDWVGLPDRARAEEIVRERWRASTDIEAPKAVSERARTPNEDLHHLPPRLARRVRRAMAPGEEVIFARQATRIWSATPTATLLSLGMPVIFFCLTGFIYLQRDGRLFGLIVLTPFNLISVFLLLDLINKLASTWSTVHVVTNRRAMTLRRGLQSQRKIHDVERIRSLDPQPQSNGWGHLTFKMAQQTKGKDIFDNHGQVRMTTTTWIGVEDVGRAQAALQSLARPSPP